VKETGFLRGDRINVYMWRQDGGGDGERCLFFFTDSFGFCRLISLTLICSQASLVGSQYYICKRTALYIDVSRRREYYVLK
jgi:hypothetical protein